MATGKNGEPGFPFQPTLLFSASISNLSPLHEPWPRPPGSPGNFTSYCTEKNSSFRPRTTSTSCCETGAPSRVGPLSPPGLWLRGPLNQARLSTCTGLRLLWGSLVSTATHSTCCAPNRSPSGGSLQQHCQGSPAFL